MRVAVLDYSNTDNIGDNIQSLAVAQHLDQEYSYADRDFLNRFTGDPVAVVMNGWFTHEPENWPPSPSIVPIFFGFHLVPAVYEVVAKRKDYLAQFAPIGCRDEATAEVIRSWGIDAYVSGCATMTFPTRSREPRERRLILVDQKRRELTREGRQGAVSVSHMVPSYYSSQLKFAVAKELLNFYRDFAGQVVTTRIHCAMPCTAMGIPVVYAGVQEGRTEVIKMIGVPTVTVRRFPRMNLSKLPFKRPSFEGIKAKSLPICIDSSLSGASR